MKPVKHLTRNEREAIDSIRKNKRPNETGLRSLISKGYVIISNPHPKFTSGFEEILKERSL